MLLAGHVDDPLCGMCFGIIYIREATPTIRNSRIASSAYTGIAIYESAVCIEDNVLSNNSAGASGGGAILVDCYREAPRIVRNTFEGSVRPRLGAPSSLPRQPCTTRLQHVRRWLSLLGMCSAAMQRRNPGWRHLRGVRRDSEAGFAGQQYACRERAGRCVACSPTDAIAHSHLKLLLRVFHWASSDDQLDGAAREAPDRGAGVSGQTPWGAVTAILREVMIAT